MLCAEPRPFGIAEPLEGSDRSHKVYGKAARKSTLQNHKVDVQAPKEKYRTFDRDNKARTTPIRDVQYSIGLQSKGDVPQNAHDKRRNNTSIGHVFIDVKIYKGDRKPIGTA